MVPEVKTATISQAETLAIMGNRLTIMGNRLSSIDQEQLHARVLKFMSKTRGGTEPKLSEIERAIGKKPKS